MAQSSEVPSPVRQLAAKLAVPTPMRRGAVSERRMKCGQPQCRCHHAPQARHGPYFSLTRVEGGKTASRYLTAEQAAVARAQIDAAHAFRRDVEAYWQACERWADAQLQAPQAASDEAAKKGALKKPSRPRSKPRSTR